MLIQVQMLVMTTGKEKRLTQAQGIPCMYACAFGAIFEDVRVETFALAFLHHGL